MMYSILLWQTNSPKSKDIQLVMFDKEKDQIIPDFRRRKQQMFVSKLVWKADYNNYSTIKIVVECCSVDRLIIVSLSYVTLKNEFEFVIYLNHFNNYTKQAS